MVYNDENGCLHSTTNEKGNWNPKGVSCGECLHLGKDCPNRKNIFWGFDKEGKVIVKKEDE